MAQLDGRITLRTFQRLVRPAIGLRVSRPWLGYGDVLFLELGTLHTELIRLPNRPVRRSRKGQAGILFHSDWRAESFDGFQFGSGSPKTRMLAGLKDLRGRMVTAIETEGLLPELVVELDRRIRLRGFCARHGPDWDIRLHDPDLFPRERKWRRTDHELYVGYDDERGLFRTLCYSPKTFPSTP